MKLIIVLLFILLMLAEIVIALCTNNQRYSFKETLENIGTGIISLLFDHGFSLLSYPLLFWIYEENRIFNWQSNFFYYVILFILLDFIEYWFHRLSHFVPLLWAGHKVHHQSTRFNLSVGIRTSILIPFFNIGFYCIIPLLGFHPMDLLLLVFIQGAYQLFVHTEAIKKLGFLDRILVTPSVHRVHHGTNEMYIDKNFGKIFVIWDHLFGTYFEENEKVIYGVTDAEQETGLINCQLVPLKKWWRKKSTSRKWIKMNS